MNPVRDIEKIKRDWHVHWKESACVCAISDIQLDNVKLFFKAGMNLNQLSRMTIASSHLNNPPSIPISGCGLMMGLIASKRPGHEEILNYLLEQKVPLGPELTHIFENLDEHPTYRSHLHLAVSLGKWDLIDKMFDLGYKMNWEAVDPLTGSSPMVEAMIDGRTKYFHLAEKKEFAPDQLLDTQVKLKELMNDQDDFGF